jgi:hypothetical protein
MGGKKRRSRYISRQALEKWMATGEIELPAARDTGGDDQLASERGKSRFWPWPFNT